MSINEPPLSGATWVKINRFTHDYAQDILPNDEQIRNDMAWLIGLVVHLDKTVEDMKRR